MLLIYQVEDDNQNLKNTVKEYEKKYDIYVLLQDEQNNIIYQSSSISSSNKTSLLKQLHQQIETQTSKSPDGLQTTTQGGTYELYDSNKKSYLGIPATIISKNKHVYTMSLLYQQMPIFDLIKKLLPFCIIIWLISFIGVILVCSILLKKALKPTEQSLKSQKDFIASASHELKNPLSLILANVEKLEHLHINDYELHHSLTIVDSECVRMSKLIQDMLFLASSDSKTWTLKNEHVIIDTLLIDLYETYHALCAQHKIMLALDIHTYRYPTIYTDKERLFQILCIFMDNAITHSKNNTNIEIQSERTSKYITFLIIDHGEGIRIEDKPFIFDRFYCSDKSHTKKENIGLGLSIAKEFATMLNATIGCKDTLNGGATFYITLSILK